MEQTTNKKKVYCVTQSQPAYQTWYYEVVAESEQEAIDLVEDGYVDPIDYNIEGSYGESECIITEEREYKEDGK